MVIWLIGLSGAGKTTIANALAKKLRENHNNVVVVDGEAVRAIIGNDIGYSIPERRKGTERYRRICKWLERDGSIVICATLSIFPDLRKRNRSFFEKYFEVFIDVPLEVIESERDVKKYYYKRRKGETTELMVGIDIPYPIPHDADLRLDNSAYMTDFKGFAEKIIEAARKKWDNDKNLSL